MSWQSQAGEMRTLSTGEVTADVTAPIKAQVTRKHEVEPIFWTLLWLGSVIF